MITTYNDDWGEARRGVMGDRAFLHPKKGSGMLIDAWCWYRLAKRKCLPGGNNGPLTYNAMDKNHLDVLLSQDNIEALQNPAASFHYIRHRCDKVGCHGVCPDDALSDIMDDRGSIWDAIVIDGISTLCGQACAERHCPNTPSKRGNRFCDNHAHMENLCAAWIDDEGHYCGEMKRPGHETCEAHAQIERDYGGPLPSHYMRPRSNNEAQHQWRATHNEYWRQRRKHR